MRLVLLAVTFAAFITGGLKPAAAQSASILPPPSSGTQERIALASRSTTAPAERSSMRLACTPLMGRVFDPNGAPLLGATLLVNGTHQVYVTDSEGKFLITETVYQGQKLVVGAAGYIPQEVSLDDCTLPRLVLAPDPDARIRQKGKRAGQVIRLNHRSTTLK